MDYAAVLTQVLALLQQEKRVAYRVLAERQLAYNHQHGAGLEWLDSGADA